MTDLIIESESDFVTWVVDSAKLYGWKVHHSRPAWTAKGWRTAIQGDTGFPDLVLARDGVTLFAELKSEKGAVTCEQKDWLLELGLGNGRVGVWRPSDREKITRILEG